MCPRLTFDIGAGTKRYEDAFERLHISLSFLHLPSPPSPSPSPPSPRLSSPPPPLPPPLQPPLPPPLPPPPCLRPLRLHPRLLLAVSTFALVARSPPRPTSSSAPTRILVSSSFLCWFCLAPRSQEHGGTSPWSRYEPPRCASLWGSQAS